MGKQTNYSSSAVIASFLLGSAVATLVSNYLFAAKRKNVKKEDIARKPQEIIIPPEIRSEQLSRNELYFGPEGMESIKNASILIVGLGGVGSHTAHMLARAGVGYMRFVDFDQVTLSSLNRHACATLEDVGISKVECLKRFLYKVCGNCCEIDARAQMYTGDESKDGDMMLCPNGNWDLVIDAIDDVPTKARLLMYCAKNDIRAIASMGAGGKSDMTRLHISDLKSASKDPLASKLRQTLKRMIKKDASFKDHSILEDVDKLAVLFSSEKVVVKLADFTEEQKKEGIQNFGAVDGMRIRVIPVLGTMPAIMGQSLAGMALCEIGGKPFTPTNGERIGRNIRHRLFQHFKNREKKICDEIEKSIPMPTIVKDENCNTDTDEVTRRPQRVVNGKWVGPAQMDADDVEYILCEVWRNRCCVSGETLGTVLEISRWDLSKASNCQNLVVLGVKALAAFDKAALSTGDGRNSVDEEVRRKIDSRLMSCRIDSRA
jgi:tRNA A37 threonylcarbamoyladenosine dehydratase